MSELDRAVSACAIAVSLVREARGTIAQLNQNQGIMDTTRFWGRNLAQAELLASGLEVGQASGQICW